MNNDNIDMLKKFAENEIVKEVEAKGQIVDEALIEFEKKREEFESMMTAAKETAEKNEDIAHLRKIMENDNSSDEITSETRNYYVKEDGKPDFTKPLNGDGELKEADLSIDEIDKLAEKNELNMTESAKKTAEALSLTDEEADNLANILIQYKSNKKLNVYGMMVPSMKAKINKICMESSIPLNQAGMVARVMMDQFLSSASEDEEFIDIEKTIERTMKIPSMVDIYMEHINDTMDVKIPAMAQAMIDRGEVETGEKLMRIRDEYNSAFLFSRLRDMYDSNSRLRKLVRRDYDKVDKLAREVNYFNSKTEFKMPDCSVIRGIVKNIMASQNYSVDHPSVSTLIDKFCTLLFGSSSYLNLSDINDAAFYYYSIKNIAMLSYIGDRLSDFSAELISNICITILYISAREDEFINGKNGSKQSH